jgi:cell wall-associated NlpC family hydrolase
MAVEGVSGMAVAATAAGGVLVWSGIRGHRVSDTLRSLVSGQQPSTGPADPALAISPTFTPGSGSTSTGASGTPGATGSAIANDALRYQGAGYVWGGAPAKGVGNWDCSSFCSKVLAIDLGMAIPGYAAGTYNGSAHGPTTLQYLIWGTGVKGGASAAQAGDLCVWQTHMGIATGGGNMISALNPRIGTKVTTISDGAPGAEVLFVRRV